jgi:ribosomal protein S18 acetylase RimI-like enzyme
MTGTFVVRRADLSSAVDRAALVSLLDMYARDPMGGGAALSNGVKARLCSDMAKLPNAASFIAWIGAEPVGLINCFEGYSTFKAKPLLNVHDIAVHPSHRGQGIGQALLAAAEQHARERGCCKLTLEVLSGNAVAMESYELFGFAAYQLDPAAGQALLLQKWL